MNRWGKTMMENNSLKHVGNNNPSFSSTLLDQIYQSIDGPEMRNDELKIFRPILPEKQSRSKGSNRRQMEEEENLRRACLIYKWMDKTVSEKNKGQRRRRDQDQDVLFWSSSSISSDSSSGGFSSSDSESIFASKSTPASCFTPARLKPIQTGTSSRPKNSDKKVKHPISPGGRLSSFLNSLFINTKKTRNTSMAKKASEGSSCSTASSFSRSCLSKNSPLSREKLRNGVQKTVRCGHECFFEDDDSTLMPVTIPNALRIGVSSFRKNNDDPKFQTLEQKKKDYEQTQQQNDSIFREFSLNDDEDDDAASYSSSDLFELDHLAVIGGERFYEDLPVYETTRIDTNRAIASGFLT